MNKSEFQSKLIDSLNARVSPGFSVRVDHITKNNSVKLTALILYDEQETEEIVSPLVYVDLFYELYQEGEPFEKVVDDAWTVLNMPAPPRLTSTLMEDRDYVLGHAVLRLVGREGNREALSEVLYREFLDLAVTIGVLLLNEETGRPEALCVLTREMFEQLGITEDELFEKARENSVEYLGASLKDMHRLLLLPGENSEVDPERPYTSDPAVYVLTNRNYCYGAGAILYSDLVKRLSQSLGKDLLVIPSSIHELLILEDQGGGHADSVREFVCGINRSELKPEDILSDSVYRYSLEKDRMEIAEAAVSA